MQQKQTMADRLGVLKSKSSRQMPQILENLAKERRGIESNWRSPGKTWR